MFKISRFILFLSIFFMSFFSYGQGVDLQTLEQPDSEAPSLESSEEANNVLNSEVPSTESSAGLNNVPNSEGNLYLSIKGEGLISVPLFFSNMTPVAPVISLELQTPFKTNENLKWLVQAGGGVMADFQSSLDFESSHKKKIKFNFYASVDAGLRYDFQPWAASFTLGGYVTPQTFSGSDAWAVHPVLAHIKWALSVERQMKSIYVGLTGGSFATIYTPFLGLSVRFPLKTW